MPRRPHHPARPRRATPRRRIGLCTAAVVVVFLALGARVTQLQVLSGDRFQLLALDQRLETIPLAAQRGSIFDRNGRDLAVSVQRPSIYADPNLVTDPALYASRLAPIVGVDQETLYDRLSDRSRRFAYVARAVDDEVATGVAELRLPGVAFLDEPRRHYPAGDLARVVIGQVGGEGYGLDGLEALYEDQLAGTPGEVVVERDQSGRAIPDTERRRVEARRGTDLVLTLDQALQYQVERSLADQVVATEARSGMAIVLDVRTGDVLAMATVEAPDGEDGARPARAGERNRPLVDLFEPGSTSKIVTLAAAIEHGVVGPDTPIEVPYGYRHGDRLWYDDHFHETQTWSVTDILRESSNVGTIRIAERLGTERLARAQHEFGFGRATSIDFPGQPDGLLLDPDEYYASGLASTAIGYSVAVTALQMLDVYATIANAGETRPPRLVHEMIRADGSRRRVTPEPGSLVVSDETAQALTHMLTQVVRDGTGACAAVRGYQVAGKTGTSRKALPTGGYSRDTMASFVGFAPAENPRLAAIVVVDAPAVTYGSRAAAPVFSEIMQWGLTRYRVPPGDETLASQFDAARARAAADGTGCAVPHGAALEEVVRSRQASGAGERTGADSLPTGTSGRE